MLATIIIWIYITLISFVVGVRFCKQPIPRFASTTIVGFIILTALATLLSLFMPISGWASAASLALAILLIAIYPQRYLKIASAGFRRLLERDMIWIAPLFLIFAAFFITQTIQPIQNYDTGLYHAQAIRWLEQFGTVPGLGNLHFRLAMSSGWFVSGALFSFSFLKTQSFHVINGWLILMSTLYLLTNWNFKKPDISTIAKLCALPLMFFLFTTDVATPSPDVPAAIFVVLSILFVLEKLDDKVIILMACFTLTLKLSVITVLLIPLYLLIREVVKKRWRAVLVMVAIMSAVIIPALVRNYIQSGYITYPATYLNFMHPDWQLNKTDAVAVQQSIEQWAKVPHATSNDYFNQGIRGWFPTWYQNQPQYLINYLWAIAALSFINLIGLLIMAKKRPGFIQEHALVIISGISVIGGVVFWLISAPSFRFGQGFIAASSMMLISYPLYLVCRRIPRATIIIGIVSIVYCLIYTNDHFTSYSIVKLHLKYPADYPVTAVEDRLGTGTVWSPVNGDQCWYATLPCTPYPNGTMTLRGESLKNGFRR
ncbi:MAG: hypothetical protein WC773_03310 [Patescibacteria group bacterium]|jgi:hypothetical protein